MRKRLYTIVEQGRDNDWVSYIYDFIILAAITASIIPLMFIETSPVFRIIEDVTVGLLIIDYLLRWIVADYIVGKGKSGHPAGSEDTGSGLQGTPNLPLAPHTPSFQVHPILTEHQDAGQRHQT